MMSPHQLILRITLTLVLGFMAPQSLATTPLNCPAALDTGALPGDKARGCCVYDKQPKICAQSNQGFCRSTADEKNINYKFYKGAACRDIVQCQKADESLD